MAWVEFYKKLSNDMLLLKWSGWSFEHQFSYYSALGLAETKKRRPEHKCYGKHRCVPLHCHCWNGWGGVLDKIIEWHMLRLILLRLSFRRNHRMRCYFWNCQGGVLDETIKWDMLLLQWPGRSFKSSNEICYIWNCRGVALDEIIELNMLCLKWVGWSFGRNRGMICYFWNGRGGVLVEIIEWYILLLKLLGWSFGQNHWMAYVTFDMAGVEF